MFDWIIQNIIGSLPIDTWPIIAAICIIAYIILTVLNRLPEIKLWTSITIPVSILVCFASVFVWGAAGVEANYAAKIKADEVIIKQDQIKSNQVNTKIITVIKTQIKLIQGNRDAINKAIESNRVVINNDCKLSVTDWLLYNDSTQNAIPSSASGVNGPDTKLDASASK